MTKHFLALKKIMGIFLLVVATTACTTVPVKNLSDPVNDPYEETNRAIFEFNTKFDKAILSPIAGGYRAVMPKPAQKGVSNFMRNLREPWVFVNDILQGKFERAGRTLSRFVINSTVGLAGLLKVSDGMGIPYHSEDFGQTLHAWGIGEGKYMVLPFLGPSSPRAFAGFGAAFFLDPMDLTIEELEGRDLVLTRFAVDTLDRRVRAHPTIQELYKEKDPYLVARSAYQQNRAFELRDGKKLEIDEKNPR